MEHIAENPEIMRANNYLNQTQREPNPQRKCALSILSALACYDALCTSSGDTPPEYKPLTASLLAEIGEVDQAELPAPARVAEVSRNLLEVKDDHNEEAIVGPQEQIRNQRANSLRHALEEIQNDIIKTETLQKRKTKLKKQFKAYMEHFWKSVSQAKILRQNPIIGGYPTYKKAELMNLMNENKIGKLEKKITRYEVELKKIGVTLSEHVQNGKYWQEIQGSLFQARLALQQIGAINFNPEAEFAALQ